MKTPTQRQSISLERKVAILDKLKSGQGSTSVAKEYGLNESTVRNIKRMEVSIRKSVSSASNVRAKFSSYKRDHIMEEMEKALLIWIVDNDQKRIPFDTSSIKCKALQIFQQLKDEIPTAIEFSASKGWFESFKKRHNLHSLHVKRNHTLESGNKKVAKEYRTKLARIITENSYSADQVFNGVETGLFWKKMPKRTFLSKCKAATDRVTVFFCSNASGDRMLKPLFINRSHMPRAMRGKNIEQLSVHWRANKKGWMTCNMFEDWFQNCFIPDVKCYLLQKNLEFNVLLLLDNSSSYPISLQHPNVRIEYLPPNTSAIIQPLEQGIIAIFNAYYVRRIFADILCKLDANPILTLSEVWKNFTIFNCVEHVAASAVTDIPKSTLNACWKKIWPEIVGEKNVVLSPNFLFANIIDLAHAIGVEGFDDLDIPDIEELFEKNEISAADLVDVVIQEPAAAAAADDRNDNSSDSSDDSNNIEVNSNKIEVKAFTANIVDEGLRLGRELQTYFLNKDPDTQRAMKFQRKIQEALGQYEEVYKEQLQIADALTSSINKSKAVNFDDHFDEVAAKKRNINFEFLNIEDIKH